ncbi:MFS transporter [Nocardioides sp. NPDC006273]|uniref:MFS transporter n=1 Tax=Nocardioides sp. NPDC006273 TaxID=3155598 RepID=UPI0033AFB9AA
MTAMAPAGTEANLGTRRSRGKNLALLTASTSMDNAEGSITTVMFPLMKEAFGLSSAALGVIVAVAKSVGVVTSIPWALLSRRFPRRVVLATCSGFWGIWVIMAGLSQDFGQFLLFYGIASAGFAGSGAIALGIVGDIYADTHRGRAIGLLYAGVAIITGASAPIFGLLSHLDQGWRYGYVISGTICLLIGLLLLTLLDDPRRTTSVENPGPSMHELETKSRKVGAGLKELGGIRTFRGILVQRVFSGQNVMMSFGIVFLVEDRGFTTATASVIALPFALGYVVGTVAGGRILDAVHRLYPRTGRVLMLQASQLGYAAVAFVTLYFTWHSIAAYAVFFALLGLLQGQVPVVNRPLIMAVVPPPLRALAFAVSVSVVDGLAYAGYALLAGVLGDATDLRTSLLLVTCALTVANGLGSALLYRPYARDVDSALRPREDTP